MSPVDRTEKVLFPTGSSPTVRVRPGTAFLVRGFSGRAPAPKASQGSSAWPRPRWHRVSPLPTERRRSHWKQGQPRPGREQGWPAMSSRSGTKPSFLYRACRHPPGRAGIPLACVSAITDAAHGTSVVGGTSSRTIAYLPIPIANAAWDYAISGRPVLGSALFVFPVASDGLHWIRVIGANGDPRSIRVAER